MKKIILLILVILFTTPIYSYSYEKIKINATIKELMLESEEGQLVYFQVEDEAELKNIAYLPKEALVKAKVCLIQKEKRWHTNAYALLKLLDFRPTGSTETIDISKDNIYLVAKNYKPIDIPSTAATGIEFSAATVVSFFVPGIDLAYYFTKGAITKEKNPNWFKSGVSNAYDNSIFWIAEKGKKIELEEGYEIRLTSIRDKKLEKIKTKNAITD